MATSPEELRKRAAFPITDKISSELLLAAADQLEQQAIEISRLRGNTVMMHLAPCPSCGDYHSGAAPCAHYAVLLRGCGV